MSEAAEPTAPGWRPVVLAFAVGASGGFLFSILGLPLPWMMGAMTATTVATLAGARLHAPHPLRNTMIVVLGTMLGSAFTPDILAKAAQWPWSLAALLVFVVIVAGAIIAVLVRGFGFDLPTAYFSAAPGGLSQMVLIGTAMGGDERSISLMHGIRLMLIVFLIPFWFRAVEGVVPVPAAGVGITDLTWLDAGILAGCAVIGFWAGQRLRVPAAALTGPLVLSAAVHLAGLTDASPPVELVAAAQVVVGTSLGCRFSGVAIRTVMRTVSLAGASTVFLTVAAIAASLALERTLGFPFAALLLAFSPGGVVEMSLISLAMGIDTAFVSTHHVVRIIFIVVVAPALFRLVRVAARTDVD